MIDAEGAGSYDTQAWLFRLCMHDTACECRLTAETELTESLEDAAQCL